MENKREYYAMTLSYAAYFDIPHFKTVAQGLGFKMLQFINYKDMQAYLVECDEGQMMIFRGSENPRVALRDWIRNFNIILKDTYIGECHQGYFNVLEGCYDSLTQNITDKNILITGHSQGAGLSIIFSKMLDITDKYDSQCIAFEPPRITNTHHFHPKTFFTINCADVVPRLPLRAMDYRHTGTLIYFTKKGKARENTRFIKRLIDFVTDVDDVFDDHYQDKIEKLWQLNWDRIKKILK